MWTEFVMAFVGFEMNDARTIHDAAENHPEAGLYAVPLAAVAAGVIALGLALFQGKDFVKQALWLIGAGALGVFVLGLMGTPTGV